MRIIVLFPFVLLCLSSGTESIGLFAMLCLFTMQCSFAMQGLFALQCLLAIKCLFAMLFVFAMQIYSHSHTILYLFEIKLMSKGKLFFWWWGGGEFILLFSHHFHVYMNIILIMFAS